MVQRSARRRESECKKKSVSCKNGTLVRFTHANWKDETDCFVSSTTVWGELMFRLKSAVEGKPRGPLFTATGGASEPQTETAGCTMTRN
jgi:hypothetical protein